MQLKYIALAAALLLSNTAIADETSTTRKTTTQEASAAKAWRLNASDWQRYQDLQAGPRGTWSPGLDPITTLGLSAETDAERRRFAEMLVEAEKLRIEQELAFQKEYDAAWKRLYPDLIPVMRSGSSVPGTDAASPAQASRLLVFVSQKCETCAALVKRLVTSGAAFDLFLVGTDNDDQVIRAWAKSVGIPPDRVRTRQITLNHDNGQWFDLGGLTGTLPAAFKRAGDQWLPVEL
ncbi:TIGR03759 family integrating conjugative element protein [Pseudomonas sp. GOM7]|uniref:TIGR03759 family integrating conjugative element protein n=1 Tax=Pseudomonas sp. GOM7 TaxID=2998079 RepID=UPI00227B26C5|nr:TIGR03759 family integrating conjugative element protein [Pseudomonas sp. GOM7]WAJ37257.1 TIGR03759 family integrating conjugative element protein [Pseudomonas sp. GOM7]